MSWMKKNIVWVMFGGVIILFLLNFSMIFFVPNENTRGTFGDQFGGNTGTGTCFVEKGIELQAEMLVAQFFL